ncbi:MAG: hypothetical protein ACI3XD_03735 [Oscillospiraceae bacterium]
MFLELYYENYAKKYREQYWEEWVSLPYAVRIPERNDRASLEAVLTCAGFRCVVHENGYPVMYVNFTLRRYGRSVKACSSGKINEKLMNKEQFLELFHRYKSEGDFHNKLSNNYKESSELELRQLKQCLEINRRKGRNDASLQQFIENRIAKMEKQSKYFDQ